MLDVHAPASTVATPFTAWDERVADYAARSKSAATIKAYASAWRDFLSFCEQREVSALTRPWRATWLRSPTGTSEIVARRKPV